LVIKSSFGNKQRLVMLFPLNENRMFKNAIIVDIDGITNVLSQDIKLGDQVIGYFERPVGSYWLNGCIVGNEMERGELLIFKNNISCGVANRVSNGQKWFKVLGILNHQPELLGDYSLPK
jgi:hypothetical protein